MMKRPPAVAGIFYPDVPAVLQQTVSALLDETVTVNSQPKAIIVPHAGYIYSGSIAARAYAQLQPAHDLIKKVVLLGPSHRVAFRGLAISSADYFQTPLGEVALDRVTLNRLLSLDPVVQLDAAHHDEHSVEVHLPFLQAVLDDFTLIPLVVGEASPADVCDVLDAIWGGPETLIVISSDLSHYHDYDTARAMDSRTSHTIETLDYKALHGEDACGCYPLNGLLMCAHKRGLRVTTLDLRNSGDTAGSRDQVVGYGAWVLTEPDVIADAR